jgi:hypothetical protein
MLAQWWECCWAHAPTGSIPVSVPVYACDGDEPNSSEARELATGLIDAADLFDALGIDRPPATCKGITT